MVSPPVNKGLKRLPITQPAFCEAEIANVRECLQSGWVTQGPLTQKFEQQFANRHQVDFALATTSCTAALHLAAMALQLGPGDEVIVPAFTWVTSAHCAEYVGAKAVFADIDLATFNLDPDGVRAAITDRTRAIVVVHLFGLAANMDEILKIASEHNLAVIEDAACAVGTEYGGRPVGSWGDLGCFSFHPRKVITTGEGGMVTTTHETLAERVKTLRNHGATGHPSFADSTRPYAMGTFDELGFNLRLSDIQAAVGLAQMDKLNCLLAERHERGIRYCELLAETSDLALPYGTDKCSHTYQSFVVRVTAGGETRRNEVMNFLDAKGIQTRPGTHAAHRLGYYRQKYGLESNQFPAASEAEETTITLPIFPGMTDSQQEYIVQQLQAAMNRSWPVVRAAG